MSIASALRIQRAINLRRGERLTESLSTLIAADFVGGGIPAFAQAFDRKGAEIAAW